MSHNLLVVLLTSTRTPLTVIHKSPFKYRMPFVTSMSPRHDTTPVIKRTLPEKVSPELISRAEYGRHRGKVLHHLYEKLPPREFPPHGKCFPRESMRNGHCPPWDFTGYASAAAISDDSLCLHLHCMHVHGTRYLTIFSLYSYI